MRKLYILQLNDGTENSFHINFFLVVLLSSFGIIKYVVLADVSYSAPNLDFAAHRCCATLVLTLDGFLALTLPSLLVVLHVCIHVLRHNIFGNNKCLSTWCHATDFDLKIFPSCGFLNLILPRRLLAIRFKSQPFNNT